MKCVVEPPTEIVIAGAGIGLAEAVRDGGSDKRVVEKCECGVFGGQEVVRERVEDLGERHNCGFGLLDRFD